MLICDEEALHGTIALHAFGAAPRACSGSPEKGDSSSPGDLATDHASVYAIVLWMARTS